MRSWYCSFNGVQEPRNTHFMVLTMHRLNVKRAHWYVWTVREVFPIYSQSLRLYTVCSGSDSYHTGGLIYRRRHDGTDCVYLSVEYSVRLTQPWADRSAAWNQAIFEIVFFQIGST